MVAPLKKFCRIMKLEALVKRADIEVHMTHNNQFNRPCRAIGQVAVPLAH